jgi:hypothetical protein
MSFQLFQKAKNKNMVDGAFWVAVQCYLQMEYHKSIHLFQGLSQKKNSGGMFMFGNSLGFGKGILQNIKEGLKLIQMAGEDGVAFWAHKNAECWEISYPFEKDLREANIFHLISSQKDILNCDIFNFFKSFDFSFSSSQSSKIFQK